MQKGKQVFQSENKQSIQSGKPIKTCSSEMLVSFEPPKRRQCSEIAKLSSELTAKLNPTHFTQEVHLKPSDPGYGEPLEGTETAARGKEAHEKISGEIVEMAEIIWENGQRNGEDTTICFKDLFNLYNEISGNVVGLLQRGRKYGIVQFEGETLFQGRDDLTQILLTSTMEQVKKVFKPVDHLSLCWGMVGNLQEVEKIVTEH